MSTAPRDPADDFVSYLVALLGRLHGGMEEQLLAELEDQIRQDFGGDRVYIPRVPWFDREDRDRRIRADRKAGRSLRWLAVRYCLGKSTIEEIVRSDA